jgi:hypothetical protein
VLLFGALAATVVSILVRLNAAFLARHLPATLTAARRRTRPVVLGTDTMLSVLLLAAAIVARPTGPALSALFLTGALAILVTLIVIEPATERSAFPDA